MYRLVPLIMKGTTLCLAREERSTALQDTKYLGRHNSQASALSSQSLGRRRDALLFTLEAVPLWAGRASVEGSAEAVHLGGLCDQSTLTQGTSVYCSVLHTNPWHDISTNSDQ